MPEILNHPLIVPVLAGFAIGFILATIIAIIRSDSARAVNREREKASAKRIEEFQKTETKLEEELSSIREAESKRVEKIAELESQGMSDQQRREEMAQFLGFAKSTLQTELRKQEHALVNSLQSAPAPVAAIGTPAQAKPSSPFSPVQTVVPDSDDWDFVPMQPRPTKAPREANFEGFTAGPSTPKAESAANDLRAALENPRP